MTDFQFGPSHRRHIEQVMNGRQVSPGSKVMEFEQRFAEMHDLKSALMINSGTDALRLALLALKEAHGWQDGDRVLVPALTFVATVNTVFQAGLEPVLVDVGMNDFGFNPFRYLPSDKTYMGGGLSETYVNYDMPARTRAIIAVHIGGQMCDMPNIMRLAKEFDLKVIEDSCETMFAKIGDRKCGSFGDISCFSTYAAHIVTTGAGGLVCTNDERYLSLMRSYANHGRHTDYLPPYARAKFDGAYLKNRFKFERIGYSCRSTELDAAVGCGELDIIEEMLAKRRAAAYILTRLLADHGTWLHLPEPMPGRTHSYMFYPLVIKEDASFKKDDVMLFLENRGIETRDLLPILEQPCYGSRWRLDDYPMAKYFYEHAFYVPCHSYLTEDDVFSISRAFDHFVAQGLTKEPIAVH